MNWALTMLKSLLLYPNMGPLVGSFWSENVQTHEENPWGAHSSTHVVSAISELCPKALKIVLLFQGRRFIPTKRWKRKRTKSGSKAGPESVHLCTSDVTLKEDKARALWAKGSWETEAGPQRCSLFSEQTGFDVIFSFSMWSLISYSEI